MDSLLSDFDSHSESSSSDDQDGTESLFGGRAHTIFSSLEETIEKIDDFLMFERGFLHGDIVCLVSDPLGHMGKIVNVDMTVDLENMDGHKTNNVNSKFLQKIRSISVGDHVVHGPWIGKVEKVVDCLTIVFDDGIRCELSTDGPEKITSTYPDLIEDPQLPFYPGQRVRVESPMSRSVRWCGIGDDGKTEHCTVCSVDAGLVYVDWLVSCAGPKWGKVSGPPQGPHDSRDLSMLPCFLPQANWQLGDWCFLGPRKDDGTHEPSFPEVSVIVKTRTRVDVWWQDGSVSRALDSHSVFLVNVLDVHDFWPDTFVLEKGTVDDDSRDTGFKKWGVVKSVDSKERTLKVRWLESSLDSEQEEEIVSAYELVEHLDYTFGLGEVFFRMDERVVDNKFEENSECQTESVGNEFLACFGTVVGVNNGFVEVKWGTGAISKVMPYEISRVEKGAGPSATVLGNENVQPPNEVLPVTDQFSGESLKGMHGNSKDAGLTSISEAAISLFNIITSSLFRSMGASSLIGGYECATPSGKIDQTTPEEEEALELCNMNRDCEILAADDLNTNEKIISLHTKEANGDIMLPSSGKNPDPFRQFDMVNDPSNHHFVNENGMAMQSPQMKSGWLKKVHQEWRILEKDLPETIYVRVYEERMDLLRVAIVGTAGTPYHDGLFFFDIYLPPQYPNEPPMVHYNSGGLRINPNLYESGKVCLSLLNTWTGSQTEVWNPNSSTILQVLLSIQALVLNEKPYFNEAGYDSQVGRAEGEKNSVSYNENAFLVSCRSMLYLLRNPPKHFEVLVEEHFSQRSKSILLACKAYMQGAPIGYAFDSEKAEREVQKGSSTGFKIMVAKLYSKLVEAFSDEGFECNCFSTQIP